MKTIFDNGRDSSVYELAVDYLRIEEKLNGSINIKIRTLDEEIFDAFDYLQDNIKLDNTIRSLKHLEAIARKFENNSDMVKKTYKSSFDSDMKEIRKAIKSIKVELSKYVELT